MFSDSCRIYHIVVREVWESSGDLWRPETFDSDGFIHCSYRRQVGVTLERYFKETPGIAVVEFDPFLTGSVVTAEPGTGGEKNADGTPELFPHLYGSLPRSAVTAVLETDYFLPFERTYMDYRITDDRSLISFSTVTDYLRNESYWAKGRSSEVIGNSFDNSWIVTVLSPDGATAGMARVITDWATTYYLCDLFILPAYRGIGLGKALTAAVVEHPKLRTLQGILKTGDAHGLYEEFGFTRESGAVETHRFMYRPATGSGQS